MVHQPKSLPMFTPLDCYLFAASSSFLQYERIGKLECAAIKSKGSCKKQIHFRSSSSNQSGCGTLLDVADERNKPRINVWIMGRDDAKECVNSSGLISLVLGSPCLDEFHCTLDNTEKMKQLYLRALGNEVPRNLGAILQGTPNLVNMKLLSITVRAA